MIEIDRSKCVKMLVWDKIESDAKESIVLLYTGEKYIVVTRSYENEFNDGESYDTTFYRNAKPLPLPEPPKEMTNFDAMYWAGIRKVCIYEGTGLVFCASRLDPIDDISVIRHNELIKINGEVKLKSDTWKPFTFEQCKTVER